MDEQVNRLVDKTWAKFQNLPPNERLLIAISGIPGSGKTTLAQLVTTRLNALHTKASPDTPLPATMIPMDGYHLTRAQLSSLPNSTEAIFRRGAAFTFDSPSYLTLIRTLHTPLTPSTPTIHAPSFSHALKDPIENDISILPTSRILLIEGLYLSLAKNTPDSDPVISPDWKEAGDLVDKHWFIEVDFETAAERLVKRHMASAIVDDEEMARKRVWESDLRNGKEIVEGRREGIDEFVKSCEDEGWR